MEEGFLLDRMRGTEKRPSEWVEGVPEKSFWFGLRTGGREHHQVASYRCSRCGYLEHYAPQS